MKKDAADLLTCPACGSEQFRREELVSSRHTWKVTPCELKLAGDTYAMRPHDDAATFERYEDELGVGGPLEFICVGCSGAYLDLAELDVAE